MDSELAKIVTDILNRLRSAYDEYREDYPLKGEGDVKFSDFIECNERATTQAIEEYIKYYGISDTVVKFLITNIQDVAFEGAQPLYAHGYTIYEELYYVVSLASHFYD